MTDIHRNAGVSRIVAAAQFTACRALSLSDNVARKFANLGEIADYQRWIRQTFGDYRPLAQREQLWMSMLRLAKQDEVRGFEFGVAWGYSTAWWLAYLDTGRSRWEGFDRFTGLPRDWRDLPRGYFDNAGLPPAISDARLTWHVGNVEETLPTIDLTRTDNERWIILFDLDLFEPSLAVWNALNTHLRHGDLLYFDEAFDKDERHLLVHHILPSREFNFVGATPLALCLETADLLPQKEGRNPGP